MAGKPDENARKASDYGIGHAASGHQFVPRRAGRSACQSGFSRLSRERLLWHNGRLLFLPKPVLMETIDIIRTFLDERIGQIDHELVDELSLAKIGVDSLMLLELLFEFEDKLDIELPKDVGAPKTIGELTTLIDNLRKSALPPP
jgi:acyl carrier protein